MDGFLTPNSNEHWIKICMAWTTSPLSCNASPSTPIKYPHGCASHPYCYPLWHGQRCNLHTCSRAWWSTCPNMTTFNRPVITTAAKWPRDVRAAESIILQRYLDIDYETKCQNHKEDKWGFEPAVYRQCSKALKQSSSPAKHLACT